MPSNRKVAFLFVPRGPPFQLNMSSMKHTAMQSTSRPTNQLANEETKLASDRPTGRPNVGRRDGCRDDRRGGRQMTQSSRTPADIAREHSSITGVGFFHTTTILQPYYNHTTTPYYNPILQPLSLQFCKENRLLQPRVNKICSLLFYNIFKLRFAAKLQRKRL